MVGRDPLKLFSERVKELREKRGVSQQRLSELAGLNRNYVSDVERGRRNPCLGNIVKLAEALDVAPSELFRNFR
ncbi:MAG TPA: helix-turn-helix transcriptional regulator [Gemmatimonadaceae bacterium]